MLKNVKNSERNPRNQLIFYDARNTCRMSDTSPCISYFFFFFQPTNLHKWFVSWTVGNRLLKPLCGKMLDWPNFHLGEIIGLIHALEKRYYQNKTQLRYNFGSVYMHNICKWHLGSRGTGLKTTYNWKTLTSGGKYSVSKYTEASTVQIYKIVSCGRGWTTIYPALSIFYACIVVKIAHTVDIQNFLTASSFETKTGIWRRKNIKRLSTL